MQLKPINLQLGWPSTYLFPRLGLLESTRATLSDKQITADALIYGPEAGYQPLRNSIARWLTSFYRPTAGPVSSSRICISNGASGNLANILAKFTDPVYTRHIWMIEPTYFLACPIFEDAGFVGRLRGVPEDDEGINIQWLRTKLIESSKSEVERQAVKTGPRYPKLYKNVVYVVPTFSNPSAKTMSLRRRRELVQVAREFDALIIADDVYDMLRWPIKDTQASTSSLGLPPPRIVDVDRESAGTTQFGNAASNGSFSKIVAPGVRVSWVEGTKDFTEEMSKVGSTKSGGAPSHLTSVFVDQLLSSGALNDHIDKVLIPTYQRRYSRMMTAIQQHLVPLGVRVTTGKPYSMTVAAGRTPEAGGFFTYLSFPVGLPAAEDIAKRALEDYALKIAYGKMMTVTGDPESDERAEKTFGHGARLSWAWHNEDEIEEGVARLAKVLQDLRGLPQTVALGRKGPYQNTRQPLELNFD
ncbi:MAG: hypothetical protein Q9227_002261 [Pyrenula ochraceoflavens]